jgi:hypothetical protein
LSIGVVMKSKVYVFHSDPGHGWLAVKRDELVKLGILDKITSWSYQKGQTVYLEEDCDAGAFFQAYEQKFSKKPAYRESYLERTPIRYYPAFTVL